MERQDTRGGKVKITRRQLRRLINEAIRVPVFDKVTPEEIDAIRAKARGELDLDSIIGPEKAEKLRGFESDPDMRDSVTSMYTAYGSEEPDITVRQEEDFFAGQEQYEYNLHKENYPEIVELILSGGMDMAKGLTLAANSGALGKSIPSTGHTDPVYIGLVTQLSKRYHGEIDIEIGLEIYDKNFLQTLDDIMSSGRFGKPAINTTDRKLIKRRMETKLTSPSPGSVGLNAKEKNSGYRSIQFNLSTIPFSKGTRPWLRISIAGSGTQSSISKLKKLHSIIGGAQKYGE